MRAEELSSTESLAESRVAEALVIKDFAKHEVWEKMGLWVLKQKVKDSDEEG